MGYVHNGFALHQNTRSKTEMRVYEYIVKVRDRAAKSLRNIAERSGVADNKLTRMVSHMRSASNEGSRMSGVFSKLGRLLAGAFIVGSLSGFISNVINVRAEFEKYEAVLTNTFQSAQAGQTAMNMIKDFAAKTPFQLNELTGAYVKLVNRGFVPTQKQMRSLGDLASSQGKTFDQLTEAILDAETSEFERLKEFGIKASKAGDKITFAFKGVKKTVDANAGSIRKALVSFGEMEGVSGSMAAISKTLGGRLSNLKDQWDNLLNNVGQNGGGIIGWVIEQLGKAIELLSRNLDNITAWFNFLGQTISRLFDPIERLINDLFGFKNGSDALASSLDFLNSVSAGTALAIDLIVTGIRTVLDWFLGLPTPIRNIVYGLIAFKAAMWLVNLAMYANPVSLIIAGILLLIGVIGLVVKYTNGWGESWSGMVTGSKEIFNAFVSYVNARFNELVNNVMIGLRKIQVGWYSFKETLGIGDSSKNKAMLDGLQKEVERRKQSIAQGYMQIVDGKKASEAFSKVGVSVDTEAISRDFNKLKNTFKNASGAKTTKGDYAKDVVGKFGGNPLATGGSADGAKDSSKSGIKGITGGGKRQTHITVNLEKLQDKTEIHTISIDDGIEETEDKLIEMFLRILNSANQIQTSTA